MSRDVTSFIGRLFILVAIALAVLSLYVAKDLLLPLALAIFLSFVLTPLTARLEKLRLGRVPSVLIVVLITVSFLGSLGWIVTKQFMELSANLPAYKTNLVTKIRDLTSHTNGNFKKAAETIEEIGKEISKSDDKSKRPLKAVADDIAEEMKDNANPDDGALAVRVVAMPPSPLAQFRDWLGPLVAPLTTSGIVAVLVILILIQREDLRNRFLELCGTSNLRLTTHAIDDATTLISRYLRMSLLINTCYGVCVAMGLLLIGVPNAILWGVLGLLLRFLPYIGPWMAAAMPIAVSLAIFRNWSQPLYVLSLFLVLELLVNNVLEPILFGKSTGVSSLGVIVAAIFWTWIWGPVGLVVAMPITVCLVVAGRHVPPLRFLPILFGDRASLEGHHRFYQRLLAQDYKEASALATGYLEQHDLVRLYDDIVLPAMCLAEADRHAGMLSEAQETFIATATRRLIQEMDAIAQISEEKRSDATPEPKPRARVLCVAIRDSADETAALMIAQLLNRRSLEASVGSASLLASEIVERVALEHYDMVILSALPPLATRDGRYLCKVLRQQYSDIPIIGAIWNGGDLQSSMQRLIDDGATSVGKSMAEVLAQVSTVAVPLRSARAVPERVPTQSIAVEST